jgi:hypothetical protein
VSRLRALGLVALVGLVVLPGQASATDGSLYPYGASIWAIPSQFTATVVNNSVWQVQAPALSPALAGDQWQMQWGCPVAGSEVAAVLWGALRTQAASSLALQLTGDGQLLWSEPDVAIPQSPQGGRSYDVRLPAGRCNVRLALTQIEGRAQHARGYFIDSPRILVRDTAAPTVALQALTGGWLTSAGALRVSWSVADNFGDDGVAAQQILVAGRPQWTGVPGAGTHAVDVDLLGLADGVHPVEVRADGDGTSGGSAQGAVSIDNTPPVASRLAASLRADPGGADLTWVASDGLSGVATNLVEVNDAADGSSAGGWTTVGTADGGGEKSLAASALPVGDGVHTWRVRSTDAAGNTAIAAGPTPIAIDTTAPDVEVHEVPAGWVNRADIDLTATDNLQAVLGLGLTEIDVNAAADGGDSGEWLRRGAASAPPGRRVARVDLSGLENGRHAVRIVVRNGAPFGTTLVAEKRTSLRVDLTDPTVSRATFSPGGARPMTIAWVADDAHSGVARATVEWRDGAVWRTLASERASDGGGSMVVDASALPDGERGLRLVVADGAGNTTTRSGTASITGGSVASAAGDLLDRLNGAHLSVTIDGARAERRGSRPGLVRQVIAGARVRITGGLLDRDGRAIVGAEVQVRDHRGRLIGRGVTRRGGRFSIEARPVGGGVVRVGVAAGSRLLPRRAGVELRFEVRPTIGLGASTTVASPGQEVLFSGRLRPSPAELGLGTRKGIVLEWRDPVRGIWRPVVNAHIRPDGTFAIPWTFGLGGLTIPMRVVVPGEVGWPLLPVRSRVIRVVIR